MIIISTFVVILSELSTGGCLRLYRWDYGGAYKGKAWNSDLPADAQVYIYMLTIMYIFFGTFILICILVSIFELICELYLENWYTWREKSKHTSERT